MAEMVTLSQVFSVVVSIAIGVIGWFVKRIFSEIAENKTTSRNNERELYQKIAQTREDMLKLEIERLRAAVK